VYRQRSTTLNRDPAPSAPEASDFDAESSPSDQVQTPFKGSVQDLIMARLDDDKAQDIVLIDLKDKSSVADAMIVASGRSARHVGALADHLVRALKDVGAGKARVEGLPHCDWVLIDAGDVIVHLFRPEVRAFYNLEKIWSVEPPKRAVAN
jgi:ribosome-associated protein